MPLAKQGEKQQQGRGAQWIGGLGWLLAPWHSPLQPHSETRRRRTGAGSITHRAAVGLVFPFLPSPLPRSGCLWLGLSPSGRWLQPQPFLSPLRNRPQEHRPQDLHNFQPKGYFQSEVSDFLPSLALAQHPAYGQAGSPPKPGKAPVPKSPRVAARVPITRPRQPCTGTYTPGCGSDPAPSLCFAGYITPPEPPSKPAFPWPQQLLGTHSCGKGPVSSCPKSKARARGQPCA